VARLTGQWALADDSGLSVDALAAPWPPLRPLRQHPTPSGSHRLLREAGRLQRQGGPFQEPPVLAVGRPQWPHAAGGGGNCEGLIWKQHPRRRWFRLRPTVPGSGRGLTRRMQPESRSGGLAIAAGLEALLPRMAMLFPLSPPLNGPRIAPPVLGCRLLVRPVLGQGLPVRAATGSRPGVRAASGAVIEQPLLPLLARGPARQRLLRLHIAPSTTEGGEGTSSGRANRRVRHDGTLWSEQPDVTPAGLCLRPCPAALLAGAPGTSPPIPWLPLPPPANGEAALAMGTKGLMSSWGSTHAGMTPQGPSKPWPASGFNTACHPGLSGLHLLSP